MSAAVVSFSRSAICPGTRFASKRVLPRRDGFLEGLKFLQEFFHGGEDRSEDTEERAETEDAREIAARLPVQNLLFWAIIRGNP